MAAISMVRAAHLRGVVLDERSHPMKGIQEGQKNTAEVAPCAPQKAFS